MPSGNGRSSDPDGHRKSEGGCGRPRHVPASHALRHPSLLPVDADNQGIAQPPHQNPTMSNLLSRIRISRKLGLLTLLGTLAVIVVMAFDLVDERRTLLAEKEAATRGLVQSAVSLVGHFHARAERGEISDDEAREAAMAAVRTLRFGNDD